jgi:hypothetical protein
MTLNRKYDTVNNEIEQIEKSGMTQDTVVQRSFLSDERQRIAQDLAELDRMSIESPLLQSLKTLTKVSNVVAFTSLAIGVYNAVHN